MNMTKRRSKRQRKSPPELKDSNSLNNFRKRWTKDINKILLKLRNDEHKTWHEIGNKLKRTPLSVQNQYEKLTRKKPKKHKTKNKNKLECDESDSESDHDQYNELDINQCPFCEKYFISVYTKNAHIKKIHSINPWKCNKCHKRFAKKSELKSHQIKIHSNIHTNNISNDINNISTADINETISQILNNDCNNEQITSLNTNTNNNNNNNNNFDKMFSFEQSISNTNTNDDIMD
eukprot:376348_1